MADIPLKTPVNQILAPALYAAEKSEESNSAIFKSTTHASRKHMPVSLWKGVLKHRLARHARHDLLCLEHGSAYQMPGLTMLPSQEQIDTIIERSLNSAVTEYIHQFKAHVQSMPDHPHDICVPDNAEHAPATKIIASLASYKANGADDLAGHA